jgi:hypothetical protein
LALVDELVGAARGTVAFGAGAGRSVLAAENQLFPGQLQTPINNSKKTINNSQRFPFRLRRIAISPSSSNSMPAQELARSGMVTWDSFSAHGLIYLLSIMSRIS